ncbi:hypothetical protein ACIRPK_24210 [Kitasatospora sp. NPDC101801]|uniref:hypothetical protein n=1 Tax=Kitasatospora sp. NPDC101801 TaxID=3364103 RepID=UPI0038286CA4
MDTVSARFAQLQKDVGQRHATAAALTPGADGRPQAFADLVTATDSLLTYAAQVPSLRAEPARRATEQFAMWTRRGAAAITALTSAAVIPGWVAWGWLLLLLPLLLATLGSGWKAQPLPKSRPHLRHRVSAALLAVCALLLAVVATGTLSAWWVLAAAACAAASFLTGLPDDPNGGTK